MWVNRVPADRLLQTKRKDRKGVRERTAKIHQSTYLILPFAIPNLAPAAMNGDRGDTIADKQRKTRMRKHDNPAELTVGHHQLMLLFLRHRQKIQKAIVVFLINQNPTNHVVRGHEQKKCFFRFVLIATKLRTWALLRWQNLAQKES